MQLKIFKIYIAIFIIFLIGCEEIPNETIEIKSADYIIENISAPNEFVYSSSDTVLSVSILINNSQSVKSVWFNVETDDGSETISSYNYMTSSDESASSSKTYIGQTTISEDLLTGNYIINFYVEDNVNPTGENIKKVGSKNLKYQSAAENSPPVISELNIPSEINVGVDFVFTIKVEDANGLNDVQSVYFELRRPDSTIVYSDEQNGIIEFPMFDNGDLTNAGDEEAGDGVYSLKNSFGSSAQLGYWYFKFNAIDNSGAVSNTISYKLLVSND